jgi:hypothetical protein
MKVMKPQVLAGGALVAAIVFGQVAGRGVVELIFGNSSGAKSNSELVAMTNVLNKDLPIMLDKETRIDNVGSIGDGVIYRYTLVNHRAEEVDVDKLLAELRPLLINRTCTDERMLRVLLKRSTTVLYSYSGDDGKKITEIPILLANCNKSETGSLAVNPH